MLIQDFSKHYKANLQLAIPIILSQAGHMLTGIADNMMVGRVGTTELAASAFANGIFANFLLFGIGFSFSITPLVGKAFGSGHKQEVAPLLKNSIVLFSGIGLLMFLLALGMTPFMPLMNQPQEVVELAIPYFIVISASVFPLMIFAAFKQFAEGLSVTKPATAITLFANLVNVVLNYLLIYGKAGFPELGLMGAGYATLISRILMPILMGWYTFRGRKLRPYLQDFAVAAYSSGMIKKLSGLGFPMAVQFTFEVMAFSMGTLMMGWVGKNELAAHQISLSIASLTYMIASGLGAATTVRVSNLFGEKNYLGMRDAAYTAQVMVVVFMGGCALTFLLLRNIAPMWFVEDPAVIHIAAQLIVMGALFQIFDGLQVTVIGALRGVSDVKIPAIMAFIAYWVISLPIGYVFAFILDWKQIGIWVGFCAGLGVAAFLMLFRFRRIALQLIAGKRVVTEPLATDVIA